MNWLLKNKVAVSISGALVLLVLIMVSVLSGGKGSAEEQDNLSKEYRALLAAGEKATQAFAYSEAGIINYSSKLEDVFEISTKGFFDVPSSEDQGSMLIETSGKTEDGDKPTTASELTPEGLVRITTFGAPQELTDSLKAAGRGADWVSGSAKTVESNWPSTWAFVSPANARQAASASVSPSALLLNFGGVPVVKNTIETVNADGSKEYKVEVVVSKRKATGIFKVSAEGFLLEGRTESFGAIGEIQSASWKWGKDVKRPSSPVFRGSAASFEQLTPPKTAMSPTPKASPSPKK